MLTAQTNVSRSLMVNGGQQLNGTVPISGSKNAALPMLAASLMSHDTVVLSNVPNVDDVWTMRLMLEHLGVQVREQENGLQLCVIHDRRCSVPEVLMRKMRAGICLLGPLLAARGSATLTMPGGCAIGHRPIDLHLRGLRELGARVVLQDNCIELKAGHLCGGVIDMMGDFGSSVTGTCNVMCAATLARGATSIRGAALEPEVVTLGNLLRKMGAKIEGLGTSELRIEGVQSLGGAIHTNIPDRIEAGILMMAVAACGGDTELAGVDEDQLGSVVRILRQAGVYIESSSGGIVVRRDHSSLSSCSIEATPYPGFPTDLQPQMTALAAVLAGTTTIRDRVFRARFGHLQAFMRMVVLATRDKNKLIVQGPTRLFGRRVEGQDLRGTAGLIIASLVAEGTSQISGLEHLDRGYQDLDVKLRSLGARIARS